MAQLTDLTLGGFVDEVAGSSPAPGGGSVAAYAGAMAAGLLSMVCQLTSAKKGFEASKDEMRSMQIEAEGLKARLLAAVDADTDAYLDVVAAFRLPKETAENKVSRAAAIEAATRHAADVPLGTAEECVEILELAARLSSGFNTSTASDLGVATQAAMLGVHGGVLNVAINLQGLPDDAATADLRRRIAAVAARAQELYSATWPVVRDLTAAPA
jgi:formiminotetrahydrofolate cyclodeaminase